jgi:O-antigen ligase
MFSQLKLRAAVETLRPVQLWVSVAALVLAPLPFGSIDQLSIAVWAIVLSISTLLGAAAPVNTVQLRIVMVFVAVCAVYALVAALQVTPHFLDQFSDPIWHQMNEVLGFDVAPRISSQKEVSAAATGRFLLLLTSFLSGFFVGTTSRPARILMLAARASILAYAIYGLIALVLTPDMLLWAPKLAYGGSLTSTFVNHNTAATFVGAGVILWSCWAYRPLQSLELSSLRLLLLNSANERLALTLIIRAGAALTCFFALLLTGSRGGLICTCAGLMAAIGLMAASGRKKKLGYIAGAGMIALVLASVWLSSEGRIGSEGFVDNGRLRVYTLCLDVIRQHPLFGTGVGTFEQYFPSVRTGDFNTWGVWDYAHSTILEIAVEMGIPAAVMVGAAAFAALLMLARAALKAAEPGRGSSLAAVAGIAVLTYLHAAIDFSLQIPGYLIVFGLLLGCGLARSAAEQVKEARQGSRLKLSSEPGLESEAMSEGLADVSPALRKKL